MRRIIAPIVVVAGLGIAVSTASSATTVRLKDNVFAPKSTSVARNSTVTFRWAGENPHNVIVTRGPTKFNSTTKVKGTYRRKLTRRGTYAIVCTVHDGMALRLRVR